MLVQEYPDCLCIHFYIHLTRHTVEWNACIFSRRQAFQELPSLVRLPFALLIGWWEPLGEVPLRTEHRAYGQA